MPPASLSAKPLTRPGPSTASTASMRTRHSGSRGSGGMTRRRRRRPATGTAFVAALPATGPPPAGGGALKRLGILGMSGSPSYRLKTRGRRRFQAVGITVSIASSTVTMPSRWPSSSTTGTASRL